MIRTLVCMPVRDSEVSPFQTTSEIHTSTNLLDVDKAFDEDPRRLLVYQLFPELTQRV